MAQGSKKSYTSKQKRQAAHIEKSYEKRGVGKKKAEERAWRTVNKTTGGGKKKSAAKAAPSRLVRGSSRHGVAAADRAWPVRDTSRTEATKLIGLEAVAVWPAPKGSIAVAHSLRRLLSSAGS